MSLFFIVHTYFLPYRMKANNQGAILLPQLEKRFTHPHKVTLHDSWNAGGCQHVRPWLDTLPPPSGSAWTFCRGRHLLRLVGSLYCQAPPPLGCSHSLIMINILLEAIHYQLPPKHLWFWTPDTSPSTPPWLTERMKGGKNRVRGKMTGELITHLFKSLTEAEEPQQQKLSLWHHVFIFFTIFM